MKKLFNLVIVSLFLFVVPVAALAHTAEDPFVTDLVAGRHIDVGEVLVWNDADHLYIKYVTSKHWCLTETHLHVATSLKGIPQTKKGNPIPGKFEYKSNLSACTQELLYKIPLDPQWECDAVLYIAAQAVVRKGCQSESAWGDGYDFPGKNWAMYFTYEVQCPQSACTGSIGGRAWYDQPIYDYLQDPSEPGVPELTVNLRNASGELIQSIETDENGEYLFPDLCAGEYSVEVDPSQLYPDGPYLIIEFCSSEPDIPNDNNCSPSQVILETDSSSNLTIDFGFDTAM